MKTLFPLIVIGVSFLTLLVQAIRRNVRLKRKSTYESIPSVPDINRVSDLIVALPSPFQMEGQRRRMRRRRSGICPWVVADWC